jgi:hypothetical protein
MECEPCADDVSEACAVDPVLHTAE